MNTVLWIGGGIALYLVAASLLGRFMKRTGRDYPATPPKGDEK